MISSKLLLQTFSKYTLILLGWSLNNISFEHQRIILVYPGETDWDLFLLYLYSLCQFNSESNLFEFPSNLIFKELLRRMGFQYNPEERLRFLRLQREFLLFIPMHHFNNDFPKFLNAYILPIKPNYCTHRIELGNLIGSDISCGTTERIKEILFSNVNNPKTRGIVSTERLIDYFCFFLIAGIWSHLFTVVAILILGTFIYRMSRS